MKTAFYENSHGTVNRPGTYATSAEPRAALRRYPSLSDDGEPLFPPFFWVRVLTVLAFIGLIILFASL